MKITGEKTGINTELYPVMENTGHDHVHNMRFIHGDLRIFKQDLPRYIHRKRWFFGSKYGKETLLLNDNLILKG